MSNRVDLKYPERKMQRYQLVPHLVVEKAFDLFYGNKIRDFRMNLVVVEGYGADHYVKFGSDGRVICDCKAFEQHQVCSHSVAYVMYRDERARWHWRDS